VSRKEMTPSGKGEELLKSMAEVENEGKCCVRMRILEENE
jgi:hypothetical protein